MTEPVRLFGGVGDVVDRAVRFWQIGVLVALVAALVGLAVSWESPRVFRTVATVYPPATVSNAASGQRYAADLQAAINSGLVKRDVAHDLGVGPGVFGPPVQVRRIGASSVMDVALTTERRLKDPADALNRLIARAGESLGAPEVADAKAQLARAEKDLTDAEQVAVTAKQARDDFLADRNGVPPASELAILTSALAQARLCASGAIVPAGSSAEGCAAQLQALEAEAKSLAQADDELAAVDRDLTRAEADVDAADQARRNAEASVTSAGAGPVAEVSAVGTQVSRIPLLLRRSVAIVLGAALLGVAVMVALAFLTPRRGEPRTEQDEAS